MKLARRQLVGGKGETASGTTTPAGYSSDHARSSCSRLVIATCWLRSGLLAEKIRNDVDLKSGERLDRGRRSSNRGSPLAR